MVKCAVMIRPLELYIGLKYTRAKRRTHFISFISSISMGGIALAVMLLITVLSVMNGFESELRSRILGMASHVEVLAARDGMSDWPAVSERVQAHVPGITGSAPYISGQAMLRSGTRMSGVMLRGVIPAQAKTVSDVAKNMANGSFTALKPGSFNIVIGSELAFVLGVEVGDHVNMLVPSARVTPAGIVPRYRRFTVAGIFDVGMYQYDRSLALINMHDAQAMYRMGDTITGLRLHLKNMFNAPDVARQLGLLLRPSLRTTDWTRQHANFFQAIATEKTVMFVILSLIIAVAAFNIVSTLVMVVTDKQGDIAILRTLGMTPRSVMAIFMVQGSLIGVFGTIIGVVLGVLLSVNVNAIVTFIQQLFSTDFLPASVYYISQLTAELHQSDIVRIVVMSLGLSFLSTLYPAWRAARVRPAEALRYE